MLSKSTNQKLQNKIQNFIGKYSTNILNDYREFCNEEFAGEFYENYKIKRYSKQEGTTRAARFLFMYL